MRFDVYHAKRIEVRTEVRNPQTGRMAFEVTGVRLEFIKLRSLEMGRTPREEVLRKAKAMYPELGVNVMVEAEEPLREPIYV